MRQTKRFAVVGSDARQAAAGRALARAGYIVGGVQQLPQADCILLPLPLEQADLPLAQLLGTAKPKLRTRLKQSPNEWQTWGQFLYRLSTILDMQNTAFIVPVFGSYDEITGYYPVLPSQCSIIDVHSEPFLRYRFSSGETAAVELLSCGILTKFQYQDDFFGSSNAALTPTMELIHLQNQAITEAVKNSNPSRFMARINNFTKPEDLAKERKRFSRENFEADGGGILLFPNTYSDIKQLSQTSYTVDKEQAAQIQNNVYSYFGVNEDVLQSKAYGDAWQAFYEGCIEPFAIQFSDVMTQCVYTPVERTNGNGIMLTSNRLQYMSTTEKLKVASQMMDRGVFSVNEVREIFNAAPVEGGDVLRRAYRLVGAGQQLRIGPFAPRQPCHGSPQALRQQEDAEENQKDEVEQ